MTKKPEPDGHFSNTHWSLVVRAGDKADPTAQAALATLCERYWFPLYAFVRREGYELHDAQDLTQAFFTRFLEHEYVNDVDPSRGKFRSFLLASLRHFLSNERDRARTAKRGGGRPALSLDFTQAEDRYLREPTTDWTAEKLYHRRWAVELLQAVMERLRAEWDTPEKQALFVFLGDGVPARSHAEVAADVGMTEGAVKTAVHRLRRRYREMLYDEIAQTVTAPGQIDEEIQQLFKALQRQ